MNTNRNPVGWFELYVQDMGRARAFYQNTFGVTLQRLESPVIEMWAFPMLPDQPGCTGALVKMDGKDSGGGGTIIYFSCADCAVEAARAVQHGGKIQKAKFSIGQYGYIVLIYDTEGNMIGLHSMQWRKYLTRVELDHQAAALQVVAELQIHIFITSMPTRQTSSSNSRLSANC